MVAGLRRRSKRRVYVYEAVDEDSPPEGWVIF
jgi:hypothetical protein